MRAPATERTGTSGHLAAYSGERVTMRPRVMILGLLSVTLLMSFCLVEFFLLEQNAFAARHLQVVDLLLKLTLLASLMSCGLFLLEYFARPMAAGGPSPLPEIGGLIERPAFEGAVEAVIRTGDGGAVILLSIGGLPQAAAGSALNANLQKEMGLRLIEVVPKGALVSLWSATEYAILLSGVQANAASDIAEALVERCCAPVSVGVRQMELTPHAGLSTLSADAFERSDQALRAARIALDSAQARAGPGTVAYNDSLNALNADREQMIRKLPRIIYDRELEVFLQPRVMLEDARVSGFEALARWTFDGRLIDAREIVAVAESASLMIELDTFMLDEAIRIVSDWNRHRKTAFALSVNLSSVHFLTPSGTAFIRETLNAHRFPPHLLTIEISETELLARSGELAPALAFLQEVGCRLSIDDFGAGQATLADLRTLPVDEIKIDGSLIEDLETSRPGETILSAVLQMAKLLKIDTVAEGVERAGQADVLAGLNCSAAQGFHFGKPRPATDWLADVTFGNHEALQRHAG